jgi:phosphatidate phosphatase APP1
MWFFKKDSIQIIVFQSYGTNNHFFTRGRALEDEKINLKSSNFFRLIINSWRRFETDEIKNTSLTISFKNNYKIITKTDNNGYFIVDENIENLNKLTNKEGWLQFEISFTDVKKNITINNGNRFLGEMLIPSKEAEFGVISDIDDTIIYTGVISKLKWRLIINTFFKSPSKRKAVEGALEFYRLLHLGNSGKNMNPIFYVSHSPWNLYSYLEFFFKKNNFPKGPILLRNFKPFFKKKPQFKIPQKQKEIINILKTYPNLSFILIGDAGEYDTDIYLEIVAQFPNRIKAIYLRSVKHTRKMNRIKKLIENYTDTSFLLIDSSEEAINHAKRNGFIK